MYDAVDAASALIPATPTGLTDAELRWQAFLRQLALVLHPPRAAAGLFFSGLPPVRAQIPPLLDQLSRLSYLLSRLGVRSLPLDDYAALSDARDALSTLLSSEADLARSPATSRFLQKSAEFLAGPGQRVRTSAGIAPTEEQARGEIPGVLEGVLAALEALASEVADRAQFSSRLAAAALHRVVVTSRVSAAEAQLSTRLLQLGQLSSQRRTDLLADVVTDTLAARAAITQARALTARTPTPTATGPAAALASSIFPLQPAQLDTLAGPFAIPGLAALQLSVNGVVESVALDPSILAEFDGTLPEPFVINPGFDTFTVYLNNTPYLITLTTGSISVSTVLTDANGALLGDVKMQAAILPGRITAPVSYASTGLITGIATRLNPDQDFVAAGVVIGDKVAFRTGTKAQHVWTVTSVSASQLGLSGGVSISGAYEEISVGPSTDLRLRLRATSPTAVSDRDTLRFSTEDVVATLGFPPGGELGSRPTEAYELAAQLEARSARVTAAAVSTLVASVLLDPDPTSPQQAFTTLARVPLVVTATLTGLTAIPDTSLDGAEIPAALAPGDLLRLRETGEVFTVTAVTPSQITATGTPPASGLYLADLGPAAPASWQYKLLEVSEGPNLGTYRIEEVSGLALTLFPGLPERSTVFAASITTQQARLSPRRRNTAPSLLAASGTSASLLFGADPTPTAEGGVRALSFTAVEDAESGDLVEVYTTSAATPSSSVEVTRRLGTTLAVSAPLAHDLSLPVTRGTLPFLLLHRRGPILQERMEAELGAWAAPADLARAVLLALQDSRRRVEARARVAAVVAALTSLSTILSPQARIPNEVVDLLRDLQEQGKDRALDLLYRGRFDLLVDSRLGVASYGGQLGQDIETLVQEDLPHDDAESPTAQVQGTGDSGDPELDPEEEGGATGGGRDTFSP